MPMNPDLLTSFAQRLADMQVKLDAAAAERQRHVQKFEELLAFV